MMKPLLMWTMLVAGQISGAASLGLYTVEFPPVTQFNEDGRLSGYGVELFQLMIEAGIQVPGRGLQLVPFARADRILSHSHNSVVFGAVPVISTGDGFQVELIPAEYPRIGPIAQVKVTLLTLQPILKKSMSEIVHSFNSVGVERGGPFYRFLASQGYDNLVTVTPSTGLVDETLLRMLWNRRVEAIVVNRIGIAPMIEELQDFSKKAAYEMTLGVADVSLVFSQHVSDDVVQRWAQSLLEVQQSHGLQLLRRKYAGVPFETPVVEAGGGF